MSPRRAGSVAAGALVGLLAVAGLGRPVQAAEAAGTGPPVGCGSTAFDARTPDVPLMLAGTPATLLTTAIAHPCSGPVYVESTVTLGLAPTAVDDAVVFVAVQLTCAGDGCEVTGQPIQASDIGFVFLSQGKTLPPTVTTVPLTAVFSELPAGTYIVDVAAAGVLSQWAAGQVHVLSRGTLPGAARRSP